MQAVGYFKLASNTIFKMRKKRTTKKQFLLESGHIIMYEDFWTQCTLVCIFNNPVLPVQQKHCFDKLKNLIFQCKSIANINKKFHEVKLGILDIMTGLEGTDRWSTKLTDIKSVTFNDYKNTLATHSTSWQDPKTKGVGNFNSGMEFNLAAAKQIIKRKYARVNNPFGDDSAALVKEVQGVIDAEEDEVRLRESIT